MKRNLPRYLDALTTPGLAIYNAGTDIFEGDRLGGLKVSPAGILQRDLFVVEELKARKIPTVMLLSGGYSPTSYLLVANTVAKILDN